MGGFLLVEGFQLPLIGVDHPVNLHRNGFEIGSHFLTHRSLSGLSPSEAYREILIFRKQLEKRLDLTVGSFSYPYGEHTNLIQNLVASAGYKRAVTTDRGLGPRFPDWFNLPRLNVNGTMSMGEFKLKTSRLLKLLS